MNLARHNKYVFLRIRILSRILKSGKLSIRKLTNLIRCLFSYSRRSVTSGTLPFVICFELSNRCNALCGVCRNVDGDIIDRNPKGTGHTIETGEMSPEMFKGIIDQVKDHIIVAVMYMNGEPLLYRHLCSSIKYASEHRVATMISTNGFLLTEEISRELLESGLDFIKIAISGFSRNTATIQHKTGDIEKVKEQIRKLVAINLAKGYGAVVMLDYISYPYNDHEQEAARKFCKELGIILNIRPGLPLGADGYIMLPSESQPEKTDQSLCDWPWKMLAINWNGELLPCCDYALWSNTINYGTFINCQSSLKSIWNGDKLAAYRNKHINHGREAFATCAKCHRKGARFSQ